MYIYTTLNQKSTQHILDPDVFYHSYSFEKKMYDYFKELHITPNAMNISGIYMQVNIKDIPFEKYPFVYVNLSKHIQQKIVYYLDIGNANLFNDNSNVFFITMFDVSEEQIQFAITQFYKDIQFKTFHYHHKNYCFQVNCGVYISNIYISTSDFFTLTYEQFKNSMQHQNCFISTKSHLLIR